MINIEQFLRGYIEAALWSTTDCRDEEGNDTYSLDDEFDHVSERCEEVMRQDCAAFIEANGAALESFKATACKDDSDCGHDFWLTRSGHGAGFWDRGAGDVGDQLSDACRPYGEFCLYGDFDAGVVRSHHYG